MTEVLDVQSAHANDWLDINRATVRHLLAEQGSVRLRGLSDLEDTDLARVMSVLTDRPMTESESFAPRRNYGGGLHSSTPWPANQRMCMHHELSYSLELPSLLVFACRVAPATGGATVIADAAAVLDALPRTLVERVTEQGWILDRTYTGDIGATVAEVFGTEDHREIERYCAANAIDVRWQSGVMRTSQRRPGVVRHPTTGRLCWFNQLAFLSEWTMDPSVREFLRDTHGPNSLPFTTRYGNGEPVEEDVIDTIGKVYDEYTDREPWHRGDLLIVDNVRTAHGRDEFTGDREIVVGMGDPLRHAGSVTR